MSRFYFILLLMLVASNIVLSQELFKIPENPISKAEELSEKYSTKEKEMNMASLQTNVEFDFRHVKYDYTEDDFHTYVDKTETNHFISLDDKVRGYVYESYDLESSISNYEIKVGSNLRKSGGIKRECADNITEGILSSDLTVCRFGFFHGEKGEMSKTEIKKTFKNVRYFTSVYFRSHYPIESKEIVFRVPEWLELEFHEINFEGFDIQKEQKDINIREKYIEYKFIAKNLQSRPEEDFMPGRTYHEPHIVVNIKKINHEKNTKSLFANNDDVYAWYQELAADCNNESPDLTAFTDSLISGITDKDEKLKVIYYWLQDNIRYIAYEDGIMGFKPENARDVYSQKYGDCKGMANLAKTMLNQVGFDARLTWIGTNRLGKAYDYSFPSLANDNHMICTVLIDGEEIFIDPTETFIKLRDYADRIQGRKVMIEDGDSYIISSVPSADNKRNKVIQKWSVSIDGETILGHVNDIYHGDRKVSIMNSYSSTRSQDKDEVLKDFLEGGDKNVEVTNYSSTGLDNREEPITFEYDIQLQNNIVSVNDELYLSLELVQDFMNTDVALPRKTDIFFGRKINNLIDVELVIPEGYVVDYLPSSVTIVEDGFSVKGAYKKEGSKLKYHREILIPEGTVSKNSAEVWNTSIERLKELYDDQVVLKKQ